MSASRKVIESYTPIMVEDQVYLTTFSVLNKKFHSVQCVQNYVNPVGLSESLNIIQRNDDEVMMAWNSVALFEESSYGYTCGHVSLMPGIENETISRNVEVNSFIMIDLFHKFFHELSKLHSGFSIAVHLELESDTSL